MERKKRSKGSGWECCYAKKKFGTFGVEMRASTGRNWSTFARTHTHAAKLVVEIVGCKMVIDLIKNNTFEYFRD